MKFAEPVKKERGSRFAKAWRMAFPDWSRRKIADYMNCSEGAVRKWEIGKDIPNRVFEKLMDRGVSVAWILTGINEYGEDSPMLEKPKATGKADEKTIMELTAAYASAVARFVKILPHISSGAIPSGRLSGKVAMLVGLSHEFSETLGLESDIPNDDIRKICNI